MAANRCFVFGMSETGADAAQTASFTRKQLDDNAPTDGDKKIKWYMLADHHKYDPYLVEVSGLDSPKSGDITFTFIDCRDGKLVGALAGAPKPHTINLGNWPLVFAALPSTIPTAVDLAQGRKVAFLMLNPELLRQHGLWEDAKASNNDAMSGKWPGTAGEQKMEILALRAQLAKSRSAVSRLLRIVPANGISAQERVELESLI